MIDQLDPQNSKQNIAEVPIQLLMTQALCLYQSVAQDKKQKIMEDNPDCKNLIDYVLSKDMLNQWPCIYNYPLTLQKYIELMYRWAFFFKGE